MNKLMSVLLSNVISEFILSIDFTKQLHQVFTNYIDTIN